MIVREVKEWEYPQYERLVAEIGTLFNSNQWLDIFGKSVRRLGVYNKNNELVGGMTVGVKCILGVEIIMAQPMSPGTGPFYKAKAKGYVKQIEERRAILEALANYIEAQRFPIVSLVFSPELIDVLPFIWRDYKVVVRYTYRIDLSQSEEDLLKGMSGDTRNMIKKAEKDGLCCTRVDNMVDVYSLLKKTFARQKLSFSTSQEQKILFDYAKSGNSAAFVTYLNGRPSSAVFTIKDRQTCYYIMGGYDSQNKHNGAGSLALYKAILQAKADGCSMFDFEGSIVPQIEKYFRGFGGRLTPYFVANKAWMPIEFVLKLIKRRMF